MLWRSKKQSGQAAVSSGGFSFGDGAPEATKHNVGGQVANNDAAPHVPVSQEGESVGVISQAIKPPDTQLNRSASPRPFVVPGGYRISGAFISHRPVVLYGELQGRSLSAGGVTVERTGVLRVPAEVESLRVFGRVAAPVKATTLVEVLAGGDVQDSLATPVLRVAPGGRVSGGQLRVGRC